MEWNASNGRFSISISTEQALQCTRPGEASPAVNKLAAVREIAEQLDRIKPADLVEELQGYGAWSDIELEDYGWNRLRMLWLACHDVVEDAAELARYPEGRGD